MDRDGSEIGGGGGHEHRFSAGARVTAMTVSRRRGDVGTLVGERSDESRGACINSRRFALARPADGEIQAGAVSCLLHAQPKRARAERLASPRFTTRSGLR